MYPNKMMPNDMPEADAMPDEPGGSKMDGGLGSGVEPGISSSELSDGCQKLATFPLTGEFWTRPPKHGQA